MRPSVILFINWTSGDSEVALKWWEVKELTDYIKEGRNMLTFQLNALIF